MVWRAPASLARSPATVTSPFRLCCRTVAPTRRVFSRPRAHTPLCRGPVSAASRCSAPPTQDPRCTDSGPEPGPCPRRPPRRARFRSEPREQGLVTAALHRPTHAPRTPLISFRHSPGSSSHSQERTRGPVTWPIWHRSRNSQAAASHLDPVSFAL